MRFPRTISICSYSTSTNFSSNIYFISSSCCYKKRGVTRTATITVKGSHISIWHIYRPFYSNSCRIFGLLISWCSFRFMIPRYSIPLWLENNIVCFMICYLCPQFTTSNPCKISPWFTCISYNFIINSNVPFSYSSPNCFKMLYWSSDFRCTRLCTNYNF